MMRVKKTDTSKDRVAVIWCRVSTKEQFKNNCSIDVQKKECREYATQHNIQVIGEYEGKGESAKTTNGRQFQEMLKVVTSNKKVNTILVRTYDRFSRTGGEGIVVKEMLRKRGVDLIAVAQPVEKNTQGEFLEDLYLILSKFDNSQRRDKCLAGIKGCMERGDWCCRVPMGFSRKKVDKRHIITVNETGKILREAFLWKANENITSDEIMRRLNRRGVFIKKSQLSEMFRNKFYCGMIRHWSLGEDWIRGNQEILIEPEIFDKVNRKMNERHLAGYEKQESNNFPLKGHVFCPDCHRPFTAYTVKKKNRDYYKCNTKGCCHNRAADVMHQKYINLLSDYRIPKCLFPILQRVFTKVFWENNQREKEEIKSLNIRLTDCEVKAKAVRLRYGLGEIDKEIYDDTMNVLEEQKDEIEQNLELYKNKLSNLDRYTTKVLKMSCKLGDLWQKGNARVCQKLQNLVFPQGIEWDDKNDDYRTFSENEVFRLFRKISTTYKYESKKNTPLSSEVSALVENIGNSFLW